MTTIFPFRKLLGLPNTFAVVVGVVVVITKAITINKLYTSVYPGCCITSIWYIIPSAEENISFGKSDRNQKIYI